MFFDCISIFTILTELVYTDSLLIIVLCDFPQNIGCVSIRLLGKEEPMASLCMSELKTPETELEFTTAGDVGAIRSKLHATNSPKLCNIIKRKKVVVVGFPDIPRTT